MNKKGLISVLLAGLVFNGLSATAQTPSSTYHEEEKAYRARQDEGSRLYRTFGERSPQYQEWLRRERALTGQPQPPVTQVNQGLPAWQLQQQQQANCRPWKNKKNKRWSARASNPGNWNWDAHNWAEQRAYLRSHWQDPGRFSLLQQQQLDDQLRAQWLQYHHNDNRWRNSNWNQYCDPRFLDYLHARNPGLLQQVRARLGF